MIPCSFIILCDLLPVAPGRDPPFHDLNVLGVIVFALDQYSYMPFFCHSVSVKFCPLVDLIFNLGLYTFRLISFLVVSLMTLMTPFLPHLALY